MFCYKCGNQIREDQAFCDKCGAPQNKPNNATESTNNPLESQEESRSSILQFIRGIPFGLVFLAFLLPLFVVSCPQVGKDIASYSAYQSMDIVGSLSEMFHQMGEFAADSDIKELQGSLFKFGVMCAVMLVLTVAAFGFSFIKRIVAAVLGIAGLLDMMIIVFSLCGKSTNVVAVSPGSGFYLAVLLFLAGIIMCFIAPKNEKELPSGAKIGIYIGIVVISAIIVVVGFSGTGSANKDSQDGQTMTDPRDGQTYRIVTIGSQTWMAENLNFKTTGSDCFKDQSKNCEKYGRRYTRNAAINACPNGWRLPSKADFVNAAKYYGGELDVDNGFAWWNTGDFIPKLLDDVVMPEGYYFVNGSDPNVEDSQAVFWTSSDDNRQAYYMFHSKKGTALAMMSRDYAKSKFSVRCVKD